MAAGFNPRAPCGARLDVAGAAETPVTFQSTRPVWGATFEDAMIAAGIMELQSTRPMRGATDIVPCAFPVTRVSIHAPRAGRDLHSS